VTREALILPDAGVRAEVEALVGDGYEPAWYTSLNADPDTPAWFLARAEGRLVAFLTVFAPSAEACEVQAWVDPTWRRRGLFSALLADARALWSAPGRRWLLVVDRDEGPGPLVARRRGTWSFTEKTLGLAVADRPPFQGLVDGLALALAGPEDRLGAAEALAAANGEAVGGYLDFLGKVLDDPGRSLAVLRWKGRLVGCLGVHRSGPQTELFALGLVPEVQGRGWGRALVTAVLALQAEGTEEFLLEVDSTNGRAEALYRSLGFTDRTVTDYFELVETKIVETEVAETDPQETV